MIHLKLFPKVKQPYLQKVPIRVERSKTSGALAMPGFYQFHILVLGSNLFQNASIKSLPFALLAGIQSADLQEDDPDEKQIWQWTWLRGRGNM